jgi:hypothetical protein
MNMIDLHEFCMDWQMDMVSKDQLWIEFIAKDWHWEDFQKAAKEKGWYVPSMDCLKELD